MKTIDIHTHGIGGYDTRTTDFKQLLNITRLQGLRGVSEIILTVYPATIKLMRENMENIRKAMDMQNQSNDEGAKISGVHLEGPFLNPSYCGSLNAMTFLEPREKYFYELIDGYENIIKIMTIAPELDGAPELIKKMSDIGIIASMGHSDATYNEAENGYNHGAKGVTHIFNAMKGFHHREPGLAGFGLLNKEVYIEIIADPFHLHEKTIDLIFSVKNPERIIIISDSVKETGTSSENKGIYNNYGKLLGGGITITESAKRLIDSGYENEIIMNCITSNPKKYLGKE
ncbi:MAG: hypothetical protein HXY52_05280 [Nitrospirae bacterium]|jgi:N-acetylglucosamine-6-phosphate deacetylase|nr:hypothetical protein [Nitrospirota bacterium]